MVVICGVVCVWCEVVVFCGGCVMGVVGWKGVCVYGDVVGVDLGGGGGMYCCCGWSDWWVCDGVDGLCCGRGGCGREVVDGGGIGCVNY